MCEKRITTSTESPQSTPAAHSTPALSVRMLSIPNIHSVFQFYQNMVDCTTSVWILRHQLVLLDLATDKMNNCISFSLQSVNELIWNSSQSSHQCVILHSWSKISYNWLHCLMGKHLHFLFRLIASIYISEAAASIAHLHAMMCSTVVHTLPFLFIHSPHSHLLQTDDLPALC